MKKAFTLIELMVSIALILLVTSIIGINVNKALKNHKFISKIKKIESYIEYVKKMALIHQTDVYFILNQDLKGSYLKIGTDEVNGFFKNQKVKEEIFENVFFSFNNERNVIIIFSSTGNVFPKGEFIFSDNKDKEIKLSL